VLRVRGAATGKCQAPAGHRSAVWTVTFLVSRQRARHLRGGNLLRQYLVARRLGDVPRGIAPLGHGHPDLEPSPARVPQRGMGLIPKPAQR